MTDLTQEEILGWYAELPQHGPHDAGVGHALITMVEPHEGHEHAYNRWYEDHHFFDGALQCPWMFSGRRWVAPWHLQQLRYPADSPVANPVNRGPYIATYWVTKDRVPEHQAWVSSANATQTAIGNVNRDRTHVFTSFQDKIGTVYRSEEVPNDRFTLLDPAAGLVVETIDAPTKEGRDALAAWLLDEYLPSRVTPTGPVDSAMLFSVNPPFSGMKPEVFAVLGNVDGGGRRLTILWFLNKEPLSIWEEHFANEVEQVRAGGLGEVTFVAPFIPSKMGTTLYEDQLRGPAS